MCNVLGRYATLEKLVANLVTSRLVLEAYGEVSLAVVGEMQFHTFLSGDVRINLSLVQITQECRVIEFHNLQSLKARLGGLLSERRVGRMHIRCLLLYLVQKIRQVGRCVEVCCEVDDVATSAHAEVEPTVYCCVHLERSLTLVSER